MPPPCPTPPLRRTGVRAASPTPPRLLRPRPHGAHAPSPAPHTRLPASPRPGGEGRVLGHTRDLAAPLQWLPTEAGLSNRENTEWTATDSQDGSAIRTEPKLCRAGILR